MAIIKPFCAVRYNNKKFAVPPVSPPYDVISESQRQELASNEHNMINLDKPGSNSDASRYDKSRERFQNWKENNVLTKDTQPSFYAYAQKFRHPETGKIFERTGFFALVKLEPFYEGAIYPHEKTLSAPKVDRLNLMKATNTNFSPVFALYDDQRNQVDAVLVRAKAREALYQKYIDGDGTEHSLWRIDNAEDVEKLEGILQDKKIIIADGHHRYETALHYRNLRREETQAGSAQPSEYGLMCLVNFNNAGLVILPTHRLLSLAIKSDDLLAKLRTFFSVEESTPEAMEQTLLKKSFDQKVLGLYVGEQKKTYVLSLKDSRVLEGIVPPSSSSEWRTLEVNLLYFIILKHIINISDTDFETKISYSHAFAETLSIVDNGDATIAFLLPPCRKEGLEKVTAAHEVMPQKSTYFFPKIFSGFVIYEHEWAAATK